MHEPSLTEVYRPLIMICPVRMRIRVRRSIACLGLLGVIGLPYLPPAHIHVHARAHGGYSQLVHRHPGRQHSSHSNVDQSTGRKVGAQLEGRRASPPQWIDSVFVRPVQRSSASPETQPTPWVPQVVDPLLGIDSAPEHVDASAHDPPWATSHDLRGPPVRL